MFLFIKDLLSYLNPEKIIGLAGEAALPVLALIIFAETGLMVGFFLPGDSLLFIAGMYCATGDIKTSIEVLVGVLIASAIIGDQVGYMIGRKMGKALFTKEESFFFKPKYVEYTRAFYERHGGKTIIIGRFVPFVRTFAPMIAGVAELEYKKFIPYNVIGGIVWISSMSLLGYVLGIQFKAYVKYITIGIIIVSVIPIFTTYFNERKLARLRAKEFENNLKDIGNNS